MRGAYAIARHEVVRRWPLVVVGLALGLAALALPEPDSRALIELADALVTLMCGVCWFIAFTAGLSLLGRPLHDGRLAFYFTRPISATGIAIGKIAGGLVAITCMHVALAVPLAHAFRNTGAANDNDLASAATFVGVGFFIVGVVVGILARSRSRWFVVDVGGAAVAALIAVAMFAGIGSRKLSIARFQDPEDAEVLLYRANVYLYALVVAAAIALLISVVAGISRGRTDRDLVHRGISVTLWPALTAIGLVGLGLAHWGLQ